MSMYSVSPFLTPYPSLYSDAAKIYGSSGVKTLEEMVHALNYNNFSIRINSNENDRTFTIAFSKKSDEQRIARIFSEIKFETWIPQILNKTNGRGEIQVKLAALATSWQDPQDPPLSE